MSIPPPEPTEPTDPHSTSEPDDAMSHLMNGPSGPIAAAGLIVGALAIGMFFISVSFAGLGRRFVTASSPPSLVAVNISFLAIMLTVAAIYRIRRLPNQGVTRSVAILGLLLGLLGPFVYSLQALQWHRVAEDLEAEHIQRIVTAATTYAKSHEGNFPPNLAVLLHDGLLAGDALVSPFTPHAPPAVPAGVPLTAVAVRGVDEASDYEYFAGDFKMSFFDANVHFGPEAIAIVSHRPVLGSRLAVGFADGGTTMMDSTDEFAKARAANDLIRQKVGLPSMALPTVVNPELNGATSNP